MEGADIKTEAYVYKITNLVNGKSYIGQRKLNKHHSIYTDPYMGSGILIQKAIKKYGIYNFARYALSVGTYSKKELDQLERFYISYYRFLGKAEYNISTGGNGGNLGDAVNSIIGNKSREYMADVSNRLRISNSLKGRKGSPQSNYKKKQTHTGMRWYTNWEIETQAKECPVGFELGRLSGRKQRKCLSKQERGLIISRAIAGGKNPRAIPIICIETGKEYECIKEAVWDMGLNNTYAPNWCQTLIRRAISSPTQEACGFHWKKILSSDGSTLNEQ